VVLGFRKILKLDPRCVILTSGTLSPMKSFEQELLMEFPIRIENKHVIDPCQAKISILSKGVGGTSFNFSHKFREQESIQHDLGLTLLKICEVTPGGVLVFFSSYNMLKRHYEYWEEKKIIKQFEKVKGVY
jgi:regulator of telomere elongation helicase 1